ncbi:MAG: hypothetical protein O2877_00620 [bacterium]|nr:hypothetical protein [bacterium]
MLQQLLASLLIGGTAVGAGAAADLAQNHEPVPSQIDRPAFVQEMRNMDPEERKELKETLRAEFESLTDEEKQDLKDRFKNMRKERKGEMRK